MIRQISPGILYRWRKSGFVRIGFLCVWLGFHPHATAQDTKLSLPFQDTSLTFEARAADLVARMTLEEKVAQLVNDAPAIPRLGVREYNWWNEGLHGVAAAGYATVFPQAIGMAASWNEPLIKSIATVIAKEFRAKHLDQQHRFGGSDWFAGLTVWSPNINIFRDPRWGRGQETYGEDPYLTSRLGVAFVRGLQGDDRRFLETVATPKHYAVHSGPEKNRHREDVHPSPRDLTETYLPAFRAAIVEGGAQSVMCAYNSVNGVPACANSELLNQRLRDEWGFTGYVVSDCGAVEDIYLKDHHGFTATPQEAVARAFKAGMDLICGPAEEAQHIIQAIQNSQLQEADINASLKRLFTARMRLGQFDPPYTVFPTISAGDFDTNQHRELSLQAAQESLVLLKNEASLLPLDAPPGRIAVIGPNADSVEALVGNYNGTPSRPVTVLAGIKSRFTRSEVIHAAGTGMLDPLQLSIPDQAFCVDAACREPGLAAEYFESQTLEGEPFAKRTESNARLDWDGEFRHGAVRWSGYLIAPETGTYTFRYEANGGYRIWINDEQIVDAWGVDWRPTMASGHIDLTAGKRYAIKVEAFQRQRQGHERLVWSLPGDEGTEQAVAAAKASDVIVFVAGLTAQLEGEEIPVAVPGFSGGDRNRLSLPEVQQALLQQVVAVGKPVILVLMNGSAMSINWADQNVAAIIEAWYPGGQGGEAVAGLIAGDFSPAGRLPVTFYRSVEDLPAFEDYSMANRTYRYFKGEALYPFGYGLSFTSFAYGKVEVAPSTVSNLAQEIAVSVQVTNTGTRGGDEVVQLYLARTDIDSAPIRSLVGFKRLSLAAGAMQTVEFLLKPSQYSLVDEDGTARVVPGTASLWIGGGPPETRDGLLPSAGVHLSFEIH